MGVWDGSGISWTVCKQSAPRPRQITTPAPHHSTVLFLMPNQQCQCTEGTKSMAMVDVDDSCQFSADSQPKSIGLV